MNKFLKEIPDSCKEKKDDNFTIYYKNHQSNKMELEVLNQEEIEKIDVDELYKNPSFKKGDKKCDYILYEENQKIVFIELKFQFKRKCYKSCNKLS